MAEAKGASRVTAPSYACRKTFDPPLIPFAPSVNNRDKRKDLELCGHLWAMQHMQRDHVRRV